MYRRTRLARNGKFRGLEGLLQRPLAFMWGQIGGMRSLPNWIITGLLRAEVVIWHQALRLGINFSQIQHYGKKFSRSAGRLGGRAKSYDPNWGNLAPRAWQQQVLQLPFTTSSSQPPHNRKAPVAVAVMLIAKMVCVFQYLLGHCFGGLNSLIDINKT